MIKPPVPDNEDKRIEALCDLQILDTQAEERFDRLTRIAQSHFNIPIALVSLIDADRQWFKSCQGLDASETPREISFCGHAILGDDVFYVENALEDKRFFDNPLVTGPPNIRFYAGAPLSAPDGSKVGTLCVIDSNPRSFTDQDFRLLRDLADCVQAELAQHELLSQAALATTQEARLSAILETVVDGIITIDFRGTVETFNPAAEFLFGYSKEEVIGQNINMLMPAPYHSAHDGYLERYLASGEARIIGIERELVGRRKDKTTFPMDLAISEIQGGDKRTFTGIVRNISVRKAAEQEALNHTKRLEEANKELDTFAYSVSHDLRAPLRALDGFSQALLEDYGDKLDDVAKDYLGRISAASLRMGQMVNDILALSRANRQDLLSQEVDLSAIVAKIVTALEADNLTGDEHRNMEINVTPKITGSCDPNLIKIVLSNLLNNAWKFTGKKEKAKIEFGVRQEGLESVYLVRDNGAGFDMNYADKLFGIFQRLHPQTEFDGTGVGLAIVSRLITRHGGRIWAESSVDDGATFYFTLGTPPKAGSGEYE